MRCAFWGHETSSPKTLDHATREINDQNICLPACVPSPHQSLPLMSTAAQRRLWIHHKLRHNRLRHGATRQGPHLSKSPHPGASAVGVCPLATATHHACWDDDDLPISTATRATLEKADPSFLDEATVTEAINYLNRSYGPGFVTKMLQHLPLLAVVDHPGHTTSVP